MGDLLNGKDSGPLRGYVIAFTGGFAMVGLLTGRTLSPVYELKAGIQPQRNGSVDLQHMCFPLLLLASLDSVDLPENVLTVPLEQLSRSERSAVAQAVAAGEKMVQGIRAAGAGIAIAGADTRLPPIRGV